jgi:outer membrane protein OmpA-like peptidoglycan-associated protein
MGSRLRVASVWAPRPLALLSAPLLACVVLAACGGSSHKGGHRSSTSSTKTTTHAGSTIRPVATATDHVPVGPDTLRVSIYDLRRSGSFVTLDFGAVCENQGSTCAGGDDFTVPSRTAAEEEAQGNTAGGIRLIDPVNNKEYKPVLDAQGRPDSADLSNVAGPPHGTLAWVTFPAPPASVTTMDVLLPRGGPAIQNVPLSAGAAPTPAQVGPGTQAAGAAPFTPAPAGTTQGLTLPVENLALTVGNPAGSDTESGSQATLTLRADVLFQFNKSNLTPAAGAIIRNVAAKVKARAAVGPVQVTGYTDSIGTDAVNIPLSQARAQAVVRALQPLTPGITYHSTGLGAADPVAPNTKPDGSDNPPGRALNRRVTIALHVKAPVKPTPPAPPMASSSGSSSTGGVGQTVTYRATNLGTSTYAATVYHLYREGNLALLELVFTCQSGPNSGTGCDTTYNWAGTPTAPPASANNVFNLLRLNVQLGTLSGVYLTDPRTGTIYIPVADSSQAVLTTALDTSVDPGNSVSAWIYYPVPSASAVTVNLPGGAPQIPDVPVTATP